MTSTADDAAHARLLRRGRVMEYATLGWNVAGIVVLVALAALGAFLIAEKLLLN